MSTTENGWTDEYPHKADAGDAYYFVRRKDRKDVVVMGFSMGKAWLNGVSYEQSEMRSHLFLGPLRPQDFEQLAALRTLFDKVVSDMEMRTCYGCHNRIGRNETPTKYGDWTKCPSCRNARELLRQVAALREALRPKLAQGEKS